MLDNAPTIADNLHMAKRHVIRLSDQVRQAIRESESTRYAMSQATGIDQATLSKFLSGERGMSLDSLDKLADYLNLELTVRKSRKMKGR